ncbi:hypothetical protein G7Y89_g13440 [Cudoniella acicularis]|uniref:AIG1-type G domain-containing protein n=1 Tax=Cudoniella acicularis TaxID=354080 RepID=A0A8H4R9L2_9HELO|nr:hypothetical protein G7Y89_g13440 [Cudoniella acicularis]
MNTSSPPQAEEVLIAVMGSTGSGKTTFISTLVEEDVGVGHGLKSATATSAVYSFLRSGCQVKLIDTPGFNDTMITDSEVLRSIAFILAQTYHQGRRIAGIIYLHRITDTRVSSSSKKMMKVIQDLVGAEAFPCVVLASTMWQTLADDNTAYEIAIKREAELQYTEDFWGAMCRGGSKIMRWDRSRDSALAMVDFLSSFQSKTGNVPLQIQKEMVDSNMELGDTEAGQTMNATINKLTMKVRREQGMQITRLQKENALRQAQHDQELAAMKEDCERRIFEAKISQEKLKVNFHNLSEQKLGECEDMLQVITEDIHKTRKRRQMKELENAQFDREKSDVDESSQTEIEYNEAKLKELDDKIGLLKAHGATAELTRVLEDYKRVKGNLKEFLEQKEARDLEKRLRQSEVASLRGEETRLGKTQLALQGLGVLMGVGSIVAGAVTGIFPLIGGGVSLASNSIASITGNKRRG